jgi:hypothetical protein
MAAPTWRKAAARSRRRACYDSMSCDGPDDRALPDPRQRHDWKRPGPRGPPPRPQDAVMATLAPKPVMQRRQIDPAVLLLVAPESDRLGMRRRPQVLLAAPVDDAHCSPLPVSTIPPITPEAAPPRSANGSVSAMLQSPSAPRHRDHRSPPAASPGRFTSAGPRPSATERRSYRAPSASCARGRQSVPNARFLQQPC